MSMFKKKQKAPTPAELARANIRELTLAINERRAPPEKKYRPRGPSAVDLEDEMLGDRDRNYGHESAAAHDPG